MSRFVRRFVSISRGTRRSSRTVAGPGGTVLADSDLNLAIAREPYLPACPEPIEEPLLGLPEVLQAAAVGKRDAYAGELAIAYVQLAPGARATASELSALWPAELRSGPPSPRRSFSPPTGG
jgi:hypothetical protein